MHLIYAGMGMMAYFFCFFFFLRCFCINIYIIHIYKEFRQKEKKGGWRRNKQQLVEANLKDRVQSGVNLIILLS